MEKIKRRIFDIIQIGNKQDLPSAAFDFFIVFVIFLNLFVTLFDTFDEAFDFYEGTKANIDQSNLIKFKLCLDYKYESGFVVSVFEYFCKVELLNVLLKSS